MLGTSAAEPSGFRKFTFASRLEARRAEFLVGYFTARLGAAAMMAHDPSTPHRNKSERLMKRFHGLIRRLMDPSRVTRLLFERKAGFPFIASLAGVDRDMRFAAFIFSTAKGCYVLRRMVL